MKQTFKTATVVIAVLLAAMSCTKEIEAPRASEGSLNISIQGGINDLTPAAEVKSTAGTVVRVNWEEGDTVYVYDGSKYLGKLKVSLKDGDARYAYLSNDGDINTPETGTTKLTLVHVSIAINAPAVNDNQIKIDLSNQEGENFPYVVYGTLDYTPGQTTITDEFVPFQFATSVVKVNCTGLDEELPISKAELTNVNTECVLTLSQKEAAIVSAGKLDTLVRTGEGAFSIADGKAVFQIAVVNTDEATSEEKARTVILTQGKEEFISDFSATALQSGKAYNTICEFERTLSHREELCFEAVTANSTVSMKLSIFASQTGIPRYPNLEYSTDGENWDDFIVDKTTIKLENVGDKVWLRGDNPDGLSYFDEEEEEMATYSFAMTGSIVASGNIMSLINKYCDVNVIPSEFCFNRLFFGCSTLAKAPELPATELKDYCYSNMFFGCASLSSAPELPAEILAQNCYSAMFGGCISLETAPKLPAKNLENQCYSGMFAGCTSLANAPVLPATELAMACYYYMFEECTSLTNAPELPAKELETSCYSRMFARCTSLISAPELPAENLAEACYLEMFSACKSLKESPKLPAKKLAEKCYCYMFERCESLSSITMLATDISADGCLTDWVYGVSGSGTFIKNPEMENLPYGESGIPNDWTVENYGEDEEVPEGALPGVFTVSDPDGTPNSGDEKKVHFSQGNLWYGKVGSATEATCNFEANQYDFRTYNGSGSCINGVYNQNSGTPSGHCGLFTWSSTVNVAVGEGNSGNFLFTNADGFKVNVGGKEQSGWRTLSKDEWTYLFNNHIKKWVTVNSVNGYVIAPDGFSGELADTYADDAALAANNLVFLPVAGAREGSDVYDVTDFGNYWSSTSYGGYNAYRVYFFSDGVYHDNDSRQLGLSVRLITECQ